MTRIDLTRCDNCGKESREDLLWRVTYTGRYLTEEQDPAPMDFCSWECVRKFGPVESSSHLEN